MVLSSKNTFYILNYQNYYNAVYLTSEKFIIETTPWDSHYIHVVDQTTTHIYKV